MKWWLCWLTSEKTPKQPNFSMVGRSSGESCGIFSNKTQWEPHYSPNSHHHWTQCHDFQGKQHVLAIFYINTTKFLIQHSVALTAKLPFLYVILNLAQNCYLVVTVFKKYLLPWRKWTSLSNIQVPHLKLNIHIQQNVSIFHLPGIQERGRYVILSFLHYNIYQEKCLLSY